MNHASFTARLGAAPTWGAFGAPDTADSRPPLAIRLPVVAVYAERAISRAGLAALLRGEMIEVTLPEEDAGGERRGPRPDVVLLSGFAPDSELAMTISRRHAAPAVVMIDRPLDPSALEGLGVRGAVCGECPPERLIEAIHAVARGEAFCECHTHPSAPTPEKALLSARERRVAAELARGAGVEEIAVALCISPHTARTHVRNIRRKLGARTSAEAVARALSLGLVALPAH